MRSVTIYAFYSWLHDEKDDGLTERMLSVEMVRKSEEPDDQMGTQEQQAEFQDQEVGFTPLNLIG